MRVWLVVMVVVVVVVVVVSKMGLGHEWPRAWVGGTCCGAKCRHSAFVTNKHPTLPCRWAPQLSGYMGACVGFPVGVLLKLRVTRANQSLECPILMSTSYQDWQVGRGGGATHTLVVGGLAFAAGGPGVVGRAAAARVAAWQHLQCGRLGVFLARDGVGAACAWLGAVGSCFTPAAMHTRARR